MDGIATFAGYIYFSEIQQKETAKINRTQALSQDITGRVYIYIYMRGSLFYNRKTSYICRKFILCIREEVSPISRKMS